MVVAGGGLNDESAVDAFRRRLQCLGHLCFDSNSSLNLCPLKKALALQQPSAFYHNNVDVLASWEVSFVQPRFRQRLESTMHALGLFPSRSFRGTPGESTVGTTSHAEETPVLPAPMLSGPAPDYAKQLSLQTGAWDL